SLLEKPLCSSEGIQQRGVPSDWGHGGEALRSVFTGDAHGWLEPGGRRPAGSPRAHGLLRRAGQHPGERLPAPPLSGPRGAPEAGPGHAALRGPDKNLVSESPHETQAPAAGLPAEQPLPGSALPAGAALLTPLCPRQWLAASVPLGIPTGASCSDTAPCLHVGPPPSGSSLPGLGVGPGPQAASNILPPGPWGPGAHTGSSPVQGTLEPVCPAPDRGCLLRKCDKPEAWAGAGAVPPGAGACGAAPGSSLESCSRSITVHSDAGCELRAHPRAGPGTLTHRKVPEGYS
uniref:Uncharacterized protein n=1 Tax=Mustela putorius furo TaxID=9669 RepID=M3YEA3_MUSPF